MYPLHVHMCTAGQDSPNPAAYSCALTSRDTAAPMPRVASQTYTLSSFQDTAYSPAHPAWSLLVITLALPPTLISFGHQQHGHACPLACVLTPTAALTSGANLVQNLHQQIKLHSVSHFLKFTKASSACLPTLEVS